MIWRRLKPMGVLLTAFLVYAACDGTNVFVEDPEGVEIVLAQGFTVNDGDTYQLDITVRDDAGNPLDVAIAWETSDPTVVTVSSSGVVTAHHPGAATVAATAQGVKKSTTVTVRQVPIALQIVSGSDQEGLAGTALDEELVVRVIDRHDDGVSGVAVAFNVLAGGGSATPSSTQTDNDGYANTTWTLGSSGAQQIESVAEPPGHVESIPDATATFSATAIVETPPPPPPEDPSAVTDLEVVSETQTSVTLRWTAVGDGAGGSANYAVRYGSPTLQWSQAGATQRTISSGQVGSEIEYTYTGLNAGGTYQFGLVSYRGTMGQNEVLGGQSNTVAANTDATTPPPPPVVATVTASPSSHAFTEVGATRQVTATARDASGNVIGGAQFSWVSSNAPVVTVSSGGLMTAVAAGTAQVVVSSGSAADTVAVSVTLPPPPPTAGTLVLAVNGLGSGAANAGSAVIQRTGGPSQNVTIPASGTTTATLDPDTYSIAYTPPAGYQIASGQTTNRQAVVASGATSTVTFGVQETSTPPPVVATVTASPSSHTFTQLGATRQVTATARDASGGVINGAQFSWQSTNTAAVTVNTTGLMTAVAAGNAQVIVTSGDAADTVAVSVNLPPPPPAVATVTATPSSHTFTLVGAQQLISVAARNGSGALVPDVQFNWSSSNSSVVSVDNMGRMTANAAGTALIIVSAVCCNASDTVTATVDLWEEPTPPPPPPPGGGLMFSSDWSTGTGTSSNAVLDGGKWNSVSSLPSSGPPNRQVVSAAGLDFPTENVYYVEAQEGARGAHARKTGMPIPAVGESRYYRWYMRYVQPNSTSDNSNHPVEAGGANPWAFEVENGSKWGVWFFASGNASANYGQSRWQLKSASGTFIALDKATTYRFEYQFHRTGTNTYQQHARVYDSAGTLLYDDSDFRSNDGSATMADNVSLPIGNVSGLGEWWFGLNGIAGSGPFPMPYAYYGAACIRADDWCGPYRSGEGR